DKIQESDRVSILNLGSFEEGRPITCRLNHENGEVEEIKLSHSYSASQINWFRAGSALNILRRTAYNLVE
ncbi:MAG TPA: hypothetical protein VF884_02830, partial [Nitrososphaeraceae archaeon]